MLTLNDGRNELWQWDTGRRLTVDADCSQVHFSNKVFGRSVDVDVVDGVAIIPDILLQTDKELTAWAFVGTAKNGYTKISKVFKVNRRNKPADYVFTPPDQTSLEEIKEKIEYLESNQDPDAIKNAVDEYLANNPIQIDEKDPTVPDWAKQTTKPKYTATEVGAVAKVNGVKPDANGNVEITIPDSGGNVDLTGYVQSVNGVKPDANGNVKIEVSGGNANIYAGDTAPTDGSLVWIDTTEDTAAVKIDSTAWISGYRISGTGGLESIADNANNEAVNYAFIPVEPGETYTLYNSADETWASDTVYVGLYSDDTGHSSAYLGRVTGNPFKVTKKTAYILISSANLANDDNYLNARLVKDGGTEVTLTSISASYSGGDVEVGTDVSALAGIVVTAHYSDGSSKTVTGYTLSGTIAEGNNVITVSYNGKTTAFTVMGVREETEVTLSSISATYSGGDVEEGTALSDLTGIVVTATYSDGSTATVTDYTLSGEIAEGENIITVSYGGMTTSFAVTGIADSSGETVGITLNPDLWKPGYFSTSGGVTASSSNGEMYYDEFIPVTPGETYYFYNTVEDWTTGWNGIMQYKADQTANGRISGQIVGRYVKFTVSDTTEFIKVSSRNMTLYYETAVLCSFEDFLAPEMPFESTEWTAGGYINDNGNVQDSTTDGNCYTGLISVEAGATYRFANSNPDWSSSHIGIAYYEDILPTKIDQQTYKQAFTSYDFTVPAGAKYIRLSSQNLTEMHTTATLTKIS